jgi:hypothetical protein
MSGRWARALAAMAIAIAAGSTVGAIASATDRTPAVQNNRPPAIFRAALVFCGLEPDLLQQRVGKSRGTPAERVERGYRLTTTLPQSARLRIGAIAGGQRRLSTWVSDSDANLMRARRERRANGLAFASPLGFIEARR